MPARPPKNNLSSNLLYLALLLGVAASACGGKNIHRDLDADTDVLVRQWTRQTRSKWLAGERPTEYSNPALHENTLLFGNQSRGLMSIYPISNQVRWEIAIPNGVVSELRVDGESVYFGGGDGFLYSVHADTGRVNWKYNVRTPLISRPTVSGGRLFVTTADDTVYAFDASTGQWLWHYRRRSSPAATIHGASTPLIDGNEALVGLSDGFLVGLAVADGKLIWEKKIHEGRKFTDVDATPVLVDRTIYIASYDGALYALDRSTRNVHWRVDAGGSKRVEIEGNRIYLPSSDGNIYAIARDSGKQLWKFELDGGAPTQVIVTDKQIIVGSSYQYLYVLDKANGTGLYRFNAGYGSGFSGSPLYEAKNHRLYLLSGGGNLMAFTVRQPRTKTYKLGASDPYRFYEF
ncbi:MAG: PQQ-binding-like beta-propeller repeat protein [Bacteriovoracia bacterium]